MWKKIDKVGRVVIPKQILERLNITENDKLEITVEHNKIILKKIGE